MSFDATLDAAKIEAWLPVFGKAAPGPLVRAIDVFAAFTGAQQPAALPDTSKVTPAGAADALNAFAADLAAANAFADAKRQLTAAAANRVLAAAAEHVDDLLEAMRPAFTQATATYVDAVVDMPFTLAEIVAGYASAFNEAVRAESTIAGILDVLFTVGDLPGHSCNGYPRPWMLGTPTPEGIRAIETDAPAPEGLNANLYHLATNNMQWELRTPRQAELARDAAQVPA